MDESPRGRGRPTKLTPEVQDKIVSAVRAGSYLETAAAYAGIDKATLHRWLKRGARAVLVLPPDPAEAAFVDFCDSLTRALAQSEVAEVTAITKASKIDWRAAAFLLERRAPKRWGRRSEIEVHERADALSERSDDELDRIIDADRRRKGGEDGEGQAGSEELDAGVPLGDPTE